MGQTEMLEKLNHKFLHYSALRSDNSMSYRDNDFSNILNIMLIPTLKSAQTHIDIIFAFAILANIIDCNEFLESLKFDIMAKLLRRLNCYFYTRTLKSLSCNFL